MSKIKAFRAIRPVRDKVHLVATRPVYSYRKNVLKAKLEDNPFTFLHIINPEFDKTVRTRPNSSQRFLQVKKKYQTFLDSGILQQDSDAHLYLYRQTKNGHVYTGIIAGASVEEYKNDSIKKHEATLTTREQMFTDYLEHVGFNAEPVLLSYTGTLEIKKNIAEVLLERPEYEFTTTDRVKHELWVINLEMSLNIIEAFEKIDALYIADGHHRSASSVAFAEKTTNPTENKNYFLSYLIDETELNILEFNRLVESIAPFTENQFIDKLKESFVVIPLENAIKPKKEHQFTMCLKGKWYNLDWKDDKKFINHPVENLDSAILTRHILSPILGVRDLKTNPSVQFISGAEELTTMEMLVNNNKLDSKLGRFDALFILYPATMDQVKKVADNQMIMPPKSTWVEPKLRSGLTIYNLEE